MQIVEIWPRGYAHQDGTKTLRIADDTNPAAAAVAAFGALATVCSVRPVRPPAPPMTAADEAYARMMSAKDNS